MFTSIPYFLAPLTLAGLLATMFPIHAAYLLDRLFSQEGVVKELRELCQRLSEILENDPAPKPPIIRGLNYER